MILLVLDYCESEDNPIFNCPPLYSEEDEVKIK